MAERLTHILSQRGELSEPDAQAAQARQVMLGGALDTALLELGLEATQLRRAVADAYETPLASDEDLNAPEDHRALRAIPERWARRHQLPPVRLSEDGSVLTVLSPAPADLALLIRLGELLEVQIEPRLALEVQVEERVSRLYGTPLPERFSALSNGVTSRSLMGPSPRTFREAADVLERAENRDQIGEALLGFIGAHLRFGALFVVRSDARLKGWMGFGRGSESIASFETSINGHIQVRSVVDNQSHVLASGPDDSLGIALGRPTPRSVVIAPLRLKERTVAVLYADSPTRIAAPFVGDLMLLLHRVQRSLEDLVLRTKATWSQLPAGTPPFGTPPLATIADGLVGRDDDTDLSEPPLRDVPEVTRRFPSNVEQSSEGDKGEPSLRVVLDPDPDAASPTDNASASRSAVSVPSDDVDLVHVETPTAPLSGSEPDPAPHRLRDGEESDLDIPIEDPVEDHRPHTSAADALPDEPFPGGLDDDQWEPLQVSNANFVQGYELVPPQVVDPPPAPQRTVATAPTSSRDIANPVPSSRVVHRQEVPSSSSLDAIHFPESTTAEENIPMKRVPSPILPAEAEPLDVGWAMNESALLESAPRIIRADSEPSVKVEETWSNGSLEDNPPAQGGVGLDSGASIPEATVIPWEASEAQDWSDPGLPGEDRRKESWQSHPVLLTERVERPTWNRGGTNEDDGAAWVERLIDPTPSIRREAHDRLVAMGPVALDAMMERFPGPLEVDPFHQGPVPPFESCGPLLAVLAHLGRDAHHGVSRRLEAPDPATRFLATSFYASIFVPEAIPRLIQRLHDEEPRICMMAARTLFGYRDHPDFALLLEHLHGRLKATSLAARRHAAYLVGLFRDVTAIPMLIEVLDRKERPMLDVVQDALAEITKQRLGSNARKWRTWLEKHGSESRILWLIEGLSAKDGVLRKSASDELEAVTGESFGFDPDAPRRRREEIKQRWLQWWKEDGSRSLG
ncbi:MAG: hypothetical protein ACFB9M_16560 [Myxococcota bacterium]